jgi:predicted DCC family thiol-disulfide oxidoreductase YuxK
MVGLFGAFLVDLADYAHGGLNSHADGHPPLTNLEWKAGQWDDIQIESIPMRSAIDPGVAVSESPMLVYDGSCGFCSRSVRFMLRHEGRHDLLFVTRDSELGKRLRRTYGLESVQSMLWIEDGHAFAESGAVMKAAGYLGGWWSRLGALGSLFPPIILNRAYKLIAKNRRRLLAKVSMCPAPSPEQRRRFLA